MRGLGAIGFKRCAKEVGIRLGREYGGAEMMRWVRNLGDWKR